MSQKNVHLDSILEKKVRAKKSVIGRIEGISDSFILVASAKGAKYNMPRSHMESTIGNEIFLDIPFREIEKYRFE